MLRVKNCWLQVHCKQLNIPIFLDVFLVIDGNYFYIYYYGDINAFCSYGIYNFTFSFLSTFMNVEFSNYDLKFTNFFKFVVSLNIFYLLCYF